MLNSLNNKVVFSIGLVILLGALVSAIIVVFAVQYQMSQKYTIEKQASIESLSLSLSDDIENGNTQQIEKTIQSALIYENIVSVSVSDENGNIISKVAENTLPEEIEISRHMLSTSGVTIGSFEIGFSDRYITDLVNNTIFVLLFVVCGFLLLTGIGFYFFIRYSILRPVRKFTDTVEKISSDNLVSRVDIDTHDEIGFLARAFNRMTENLAKSQNELKRSYDELEIRVEERTKGERRRADQLRTINEVGRTISSYLSLDELIPYVVESLRETFNYYNVNIFLTGNDDYSLELRAGAGGYDTEAPLGFTIKPGEGIVGGVITTGEYLLVPDVSDDPRYIRSEELPGTRSELAIPIKLGEDNLGVLDIQSDEIHAFDEIDVFTVQTIADQLAVAIQNTRYHRETQELAVIMERNRLAREIHDTLAQGFTGIIMQLEAAEQSLGEDDTRSQKHLETARQLAKDSLNEARRSVWALRPQVLENRKLEEAVRAEAEKFGKDNAISVRVNTEHTGGLTNPDIENALLRIVQESLNNIRKHAQAKNITIDLNTEEKTVMLSIRDDGIGFDTGTDMKNRFGLISMRERARLLGGSLTIASETGQGTQITVTIPVK